MVLLLCAPAPAAPGHSALLHGNLIAPGLVSNLSTPQGQPGDSCTSKVEASFMHTMCKPGKRLCKVVDESALCPKATSLHQTWHPASPHQGHTGDSKSSLAEACYMCLWLVLVLVHNGPLVSRRSDAPWRLYSSSQAMHCHLDLHTYLTRR